MERKVFRRFIPFSIFVAFVGATVSLSACGGDSRPSATTTSTAPSVTPTTMSVRDTPIVDGYRQFWTAYLASADPMNPNDERLAQHATGEELAQVRSAFLARKSAGHVIRGTFELAPHVLSATDTQAVVADCYFDHTQHFDASTNAAVDSADAERQSIEATMQFVDGTWKVSSVSHKGTGCVPVS